MPISVWWWKTPGWGRSVSFRVKGQKWKRIVGFERRPRYCGFRRR
jgi:hypothetical protein